MSAHLGPVLRIVIGAMAILAATSPAAISQVDVDRAVARILDEWKDGSTSPPPGVLDRVASLGSDAVPLVPRLCTLLRSPEPGVRVQAVRTLMNLGPAARPAIPGLIELIRDPDPGVNQAATQAIANLGRMAEAASPALVAALHADPGPRHLNLLWALAAVDGPTQPAIIALLNEPEPSVRKAVVQCLTQLRWTSRYGRPSKLARVLVPRLGAMANDPDAGVRMALTNLAFITESDSDNSIAPLRRLSRDPDPRVRIALVQAMGRTPVIPAPLRGAYLELLADKDPDVRVQAALYLPHQDLASPAFIEILLDMLKGPSARIRNAAAQELGQAYSEQQFWNGLRGFDFQTRTSVALARSPTAFGVLRSVASDPDPVVRGSVAGLLPLWKAEALTVIPMLTDRLKDPDASVRARAASGLVPFGPAAHAPHAPCSPRWPIPARPSPHPRGWPSPRPGHSRPSASRPATRCSGCSWPSSTPSTRRSDSTRKGPSRTWGRRRSASCFGGSPIRGRPDASRSS